MKKKYLFFLFNLLILFVSCKNNKSYSFEAKVIKKEVDNIQIMVDPNVELMMILGRLAGLTPYAKGTVIQNEYLDKVDEYFSNSYFTIVKKK